MNTKIEKFTPKVIILYKMELQLDLTLFSATNLLDTPPVESKISISHTVTHKHTDRHFSKTL